MRTLQPDGWRPPRGYANGVEASGRMVFVAGQIGWDAAGRLVSPDFVAQAEQALRNVVAVLAEAGAGSEHLVRLTWYAVDRAEYLASSHALGEAYRRVIGRHYPAMTAVEVRGLIEEGARVEVEATAVIPNPQGGSGA
jgi:enamine deaminase RidA (YjgF/YER057c/UK114 family)